MTPHEIHAKYKAVIKDQYDFWSWYATINENAQHERRHEANDRLNTLKLLIEDTAESAPPPEDTGNFAVFTTPDDGYTLNFLSFIKADSFAKAVIEALEIRDGYYQEWKCDRCFLRVIPGAKPGITYVVTRAPNEQFLQRSSKN